MKIVIYSKNNCIYCSNAKTLITNLGLEYEEKSLEKDFGSDPIKLIEDIGKNKTKECIFGFCTAVSPDLQLAIEKGMMIAKADLADIVKGEMNKESKQFITEIGKTNAMSVVSDVEVTLINIISKTQVRGYEMWKKDVTITKNGYYRVWIGLRLPMGEFNKMYNYTIESALDSYKLKELANDSYKKLLENTGNDNENSNL